MSKAFRDLLAWQRGMDLTLRVYRLTELFPKSELYGLSAQLRRCAVSIPSNVAEGAGRATKRDFANFVGIARGSNYELETQVIIAGRLRYAAEDEIEDVLQASAEVGRLLRGLLLRLRDETIAPRNLETRN